MHPQACGALRRLRRCQFGVHCHARDTFGKADVAIERFLGQRAFGRKPLQQLLQVSAGRADVAFEPVALDIALYQHHMDTAVGKILRRQVSVGQQVTVLPVALGEALGERLQLTRCCFAPDQRLEVFAQLTQREHRPTLEAHLAQHQPGIHGRPANSTGSWQRQPQAGGDGAVGVYWQVDGGQATLVFMAVEKAR
ncbi:hypothetical protein D3C81_1324210 [compost metagenome]